MGLILSSLEKVKEYKEKEGINQSALKDLLKGLFYYKNLRRVQTDYFTIGSAVDTILTGAEGEFENLFYCIRESTKPSDNIIRMLRFIYNREDNCNRRLSDCSKEIILDATSNWQNNWKEDTKIKTLIKKGEDYYHELRRAKDRIIIDEKQEQLIWSIVNSLNRNERTKNFFNRFQWRNNKDIDCYYQLPIYFSIGDMSCKALLDIVLCTKDENNRIVSVQGLDLKTTSGSTYDFPKSIFKYRLDIQAAWYNLALRNWLNNNKEILIKPFSFIVESTTIPGEPLIYEMTEEYIEIGRKGRDKLMTKENHVIREEIKGYEDLLKEYQYYEKTGWEKDIKLDKNNVIKITPCI